MRPGIEGNSFDYDLAFHVINSINTIKPHCPNWIRAPIEWHVLYCSPRCGPRGWGRDWPIWHRTIRGHMSSTFKRSITKLFLCLWSSWGAKWPRKSQQPPMMKKGSPGQLFQSSTWRSSWCFWIYSDITCQLWFSYRFVMPHPSLDGGNPFGWHSHLHGTPHNLLRRSNYY